MVIEVCPDCDQQQIVRARRDLVYGMLARWVGDVSVKDESISWGRGRVEETKGDAERCECER